MSDLQRTEPRTVLFLHGLESGPNGSKARALAAVGYRVVAPALPSRRGLLVRDPALPAAAVLGALAAASPALLGAPLALAIGLALLIGLAAARLTFAWLLRRQLDSCFAIAARAAADLPPGAVVVGSSNGGGLAARLLDEGRWAGPAVLLCPAQDKVARLTLRRPARLGHLTPASQARVRVVHGDADDVVPLAHSRALVAGTAAGLEVVPGGDHRLGGVATPEALRRWVEAASAATA
jgi:dienelactone hydrolase